MMMMMRWARLAIAAMIFATCMGRSEAAVTIGAGVSADGAVGVESDRNGAATLAQGLLLPAGSYLLEGVSWWGTPFLGNAAPSHFHIAFHGESLTEPGEPTDLPYPNLAFDVDATQFLSTPTPFFDDAGYPIIRFDWTPATPLSILSDGKIFLSIQGEYADLSDSFLWSALDLGGSFLQRDTFGASGWTFATSPSTGPLAVQVVLSGQPVPEPALWVMMLSGFGVAGFVIRRRPSQHVSFG